MSIQEQVLWLFTIIIVICGTTAISLVFYLGRTKAKEVDRFVLGYEILEDSIFFQGMRLMNYGGAFAWRWSAKRSKLLHLREHFDKKFQRPFIIMFYANMIIFFSMILMYLVDKFFLKIL